MKTLHLVRKDTPVESGKKSWQLESEKDQVDEGIVFTSKTSKEHAIRASISHIRELISKDPDHKPISFRIHKKDGTIQQERTYPQSADPKQSKG